MEKLRVSCIYAFSGKSPHGSCETKTINFHISILPQEISVIGRLFGGLSYDSLQEAVNGINEIVREFAVTEYKSTMIGNA